MLIMKNDSCSGRLFFWLKKCMRKQLQCDLRGIHLKTENRILPGFVRPWLL